MYLSTAQIAEVCHEANRAYCQQLGDFSSEPWDQSPDWLTESIIAGVSAVIENPGIEPSESHRRWLQRKKEEGWSYGPIKDPDKKEHPCFLTYSDMPNEQKVKDRLFINIVNALRILHQEPEGAIPF